MKLLPFSVNIVQVNVKSGRFGTRYAEYVIEFVGPSYVRKVMRRYSCFELLVERLKDEVSCKVALPSLPPKKCFGSLDISFLETRKISLETFLQILISSEPVLNSDVMYAFLDLDEITVVTARLLCEESPYSVSERLSRFLSAFEQAPLNVIERGLHDCLLSKILSLRKSNHLVVCKILNTLLKESNDYAPKILAETNTLQVLFEILEKHNIDSEVDLVRTCKDTIFMLISYEPKSFVKYLKNEQGLLYVCEILRNKDNTSLHGFVGLLLWICIELPEIHPVMSHKGSLGFEILECLYTSPVPDARLIAGLFLCWLSRFGFFSSQDIIEEAMVSLNSLPSELQTSVAMIDFQLIKYLVLCDSGIFRLRRLLLPNNKEERGEEEETPPSPLSLSVVHPNIVYFVVWLLSTFLIRDDPNYNQYNNNNNNTLLKCHHFFRDETTQKLTQTFKENPKNPTETKYPQTDNNNNNNHEKNSIMKNQTMDFKSVKTKLLKHNSIITIDSELKHILETHFKSSNSEKIKSLISLVLLYVPWHSNKSLKLTMTSINNNNNNNHNDNNNRNNNPNKETCVSEIMEKRISIENSLLKDLLNKLNRQHDNLVFEHESLSVLELSVEKKYCRININKKTIFDLENSLKVYLSKRQDMGKCCDFVRSFIENIRLIGETQIMTRSYLENEISNINSENQSLLKTYEKIDHLKSQLNKSEENVNALSTNKNNLIQILKTKTNNLQNLKTNLKNTRKKTTELRNQWMQLEKDISEFPMRRQKLTEDLKNTKTELLKLESRQAVVSEKLNAKSNLQHFQRDIESLQNQIAKLQDLLKLENDEQNANNVLKIQGNSISGENTKKHCSIYTNKNEMIIADNIETTIVSLTSKLKSKESEQSEHITLTQQHIDISNSIEVKKHHLQLTNDQLQKIQSLTPFLDKSNQLQAAIRQEEEEVLKWMEEVTVMEGESMGGASELEEIDRKILDELKRVSELKGEIDSKAIESEKRKQLLCHKLFKQENELKQLINNIENLHLETAELPGLREILNENINAELETRQMVRATIKTTINELIQMDKNLAALEEHDSIIIEDDGIIMESNNDKPNDDLFIIGSLESTSQITFTKQKKTFQRRRREDSPSSSQNSSLQNSLNRRNNSLCNSSDSSMII